MKLQTTEMPEYEYERRTYELNALWIDVKLPWWAIVNFQKKKKSKKEKVASSHDWTQNRDEGGSAYNTKKCECECE